jgi:hypothetical protein
MLPPDHPAARGGASQIRELLAEDAIYARVPAPPEWPPRWEPAPATVPEAACHTARHTTARHAGRDVEGAGPYAAGIVAAFPNQRRRSAYPAAAKPEGEAPRHVLAAGKGTPPHDARQPIAVPTGFILRQARARQPPLQLVPHRTARHEIRKHVRRAFPAGRHRPAPLADSLCSSRGRTRCSDDADSCNSDQEPFSHPRKVAPTASTCPQFGSARDCLRLLSLPRGLGAAETALSPVPLAREPAARSRSSSRESRTQVPSRGRDGGGPPYRL